MKYSQINSAILGHINLIPSDFNISKSDAIALYGAITCPCGIDLNIIKGRSTNNKFQIRAKSTHDIACLHSVKARIADNPIVEINRIFSPGRIPPTNNTTQTTNASTNGTTSIVAAIPRKKIALKEMLSNPGQLNDFKLNKAVVGYNSKIDMDDPVWQQIKSTIIEVDVSPNPNLSTHSLSHYMTNNTGAKGYNDYIRDNMGVTYSELKTSIPEYVSTPGIKEYYFVKFEYTIGPAIEYMKIYHIEYIMTI